MTTSTVEHMVAERDAPAQSAFAITPSDETDFTYKTRGIYVGVGGDVVAVVGGSALTYKNAAAGSILPLEATRVNSTGTTATNLIGLY